MEYFKILDSKGKKHDVYIEEIVIKTIRLKRGTSSSWARVNPVLLEGEPGFEKDTNKLKIGDGSTA